MITCCMLAFTDVSISFFLHPYALICVCKPMPDQQTYWGTKSAHAYVPSALDFTWSLYREKVLPALVLTILTEAAFNLDMHP